MPTSVVSLNLLRFGLLALGCGAGLVALWFVFVATALPSQAPRTQGPNDREVTLPAGRVVYQSYGTGKSTVVLLHGFGGSVKQWQGMVPQLSCARVLAVDLMGFGASDRRLNTYDVSSQSRTVVALLDALEIEQAVLVGVSMGGSVAAMASSLFPRRIRGAVLIAPSGYPGSLKYGWPRGMFYKPGWANRLGQWASRSQIYRGLWPKSLASQGLGVTSSYDEHYAEALGRIEQPVLLMWSSTDATVPQSYREHYLQSIPSARAVAVGAAGGHAVIDAAPEQISKQICDFVAALP